MVAHQANMDHQDHINNLTTKAGAVGHRPGDTMTVHQEEECITSNNHRWDTINNEADTAHQEQKGSVLASWEL